MGLISTMTGSEAQSDAFVKIYAFHVGKDGKDQFISKAKTMTSAVKGGVPTYEGAVAGITKEIGGSWIMQSYEVGEGEILKINTQKKEGWNTLLRSAQIFLHVRENGPLQEVTINLLNRPRSRFPRAVFSGRFDILTPDEVFNMYGIVVPAHYHRFFSPLAQEKVYSIRQLQPEKAPLERVEMRKVKGDDGITTTVRVRKRFRNLEVN